MSGGGALLQLSTDTGGMSGQYLEGDLKGDLKGDLNRINLRPLPSSEPEYTECLKQSFVTCKAHNDPHQSNQHDYHECVIKHFQKCVANVEQGTS